jgi:histidyl-tRNA synthetase
MRILDCKEEKCKRLNQGAPIILDFLCEECKEHFENVKKSLDDLEIKYDIDPEIVRGLDYYTKTVFEFISGNEGYTVLAGGRYDGLVKELDGQDTPALGFALGMERLIEIFEKYNEGNLVKEETPVLFIAKIGEEANKFATKIVHEIRQKGFFVEKDITGKSINAQFKYANKLGAKYVITIGDNELQTKKVELKNMETGEIKQIGLNIDDIICNLEQLKWV